MTNTNSTSREIARQFAIIAAIVFAPMYAIAMFFSFIA